MPRKQEKQVGEIEEKLQDTQTKISEYQQKINSREETSLLLDEELEQTNLLVGKTKGL